MACLFNTNDRVACFTAMASFFFFVEKLTIQTNPRLHWVNFCVSLLLMKDIKEGKFWWPDRNVVRQHYLEVMSVHIFENFAVLESKDVCSPV